MADQKISQMPQAATLTGAELVPLVQSGVNVQTTTFDAVLQPLEATNIVGIGTTSPNNYGAGWSVLTLGGTSSNSNGELDFVNTTGNSHSEFYKDGNDLTLANFPNTTGNITIQATNGNLNLTAGNTIVNNQSVEFVGTIKTDILTGYLKGNGSGGVVTAASSIPSGDISGLGTMATQNANNVAITGGSISVPTLETTGITGYLYGNNTNPVTGSTTIPNTDISGLGTMSTQNANNVAITGGTINNTTIGATTPSRVNASLLRTTALTGFLYGNGASADVTNVPVIGTTQGGTGLTSYTTGDILYASATNTLAKLAGNTSTVNKFLRQKGDGSVAFAPDWDIIDPSDINTQYGAFQDNVQQLNTTPGTGIPVYLRTTDYSNGVSVVTDLSGKLNTVQIAITGVYNIQFSLQLAKVAGGGSLADVYVWPRVNGTDIPDSNTRVSLQGANTYVVAAWNYFLQLNAGDKLQLMWGSSDVNVNIVYLGTPPIGPEIPSAIVTVNQVS